MLDGAVHVRFLLTTLAPLQCQTVLRDLFAAGVPGEREEFAAYRLLYAMQVSGTLLLHSALREARALLPHPMVQHALEVRAAAAAAVASPQPLTPARACRSCKRCSVATFDVSTSCGCPVSPALHDAAHRCCRRCCCCVLPLLTLAPAPRMSAYIMDGMVPRVRVAAFAALCCAIRPSLPVSALQARHGLVDVRASGKLQRDCRPSAELAGIAGRGGVRGVPAAAGGSVDAHVPAHRPAVAAQRGRVRGGGGGVGSGHSRLRLRCPCSGRSWGLGGRSGRRCIRRSKRRSGRRLVG